MKSVLETLRGVPFLHELPESTLVEVARRCAETVHMRGETIFVEGDPPKGLLVVREGAVKIYKTGEGGREQILEIEGPGRCVAELPLFDGRPYPASCAAVHDSVLLVIRPRDFQELLARYPDLTRTVIASLAFRLRRMVMLVQELSLRDVRQRLWTCARSSRRTARLRWLFRTRNWPHASARCAISCPEHWPRSCRRASSASK
jgi:CRP-like cAMP-binding protein